MVIMVLIGQSKFGQNNRISLVEGLPELLNLELGDYVEFYIEGGKIILRKQTKRYHGFDIEGEEITKKLCDLEKEKMENDKDDLDLDPDQAEQLAREEYAKDKAERTKRKESTSV